jgi:pSer/pThr/pTyr-binding forkhead associated (FHA) protein
MNKCRLVLRKIKTGEEFALTGVVPVGREVENGIKLVAVGTSRHHATLSVVDGAVYLEDKGSRNGSSINGLKITARTALKPGDRVSFDTEEFELRMEGGDETVAHSVKSDSPGSWADVEFDVHGADGTERFDPNQLKEYLAKAKERQQQQTQLDIKEPCLRISSASQPTFTFPLKISGSPVQEWTVGRSADSAIRLDEAGVSERHAKIVREGARWKLLDAISSNGTYVNDLQVGMCYLAAGDTLRFGRVQCVFNLPRKNIGTRPQGQKRNLKKVVWVGLTLSFTITLMILYLLLRARIR